MLPRVLPESERRRCDKAWGLALQNYGVIESVHLAGRNVRRRKDGKTKKDKQGDCPSTFHAFRTHDQWKASSDVVRMYTLALHGCGRDAMFATRDRGERQTSLSASRLPPLRRCRLLQRADQRTVQVVFPLPLCMSTPDRWSTERERERGCLLTASTQPRSLTTSLLRPDPLLPPPSLRYTPNKMLHVCLLCSLAL